MEEYKLTLCQKKIWWNVKLAADGKDNEQTDGIGASEAIKMIENLPIIVNSSFGFGFRPHTPLWHQKNILTCTIEKKW